MEKLVIAVDGPSASGKSTVCDLLAKKLNINHLSSGSLYRAVALYLYENNIDYDKNIEKYLKDINIDVVFENYIQKIFLNNEDVTSKLNQEIISTISSIISKKEYVRDFIKSLQLMLANEMDIIIDGRDITSVVLKDAKYKFYIDASCEERARRRFLQQQQKISYEQILEDIISRDKRDMERELCPLIKTDDSIVINTDNLTIEEVVEKMYKIIIK